MSRPAATPPELRGFSYVRLLGSGGFSDVYLYEQHLPKRQVAVKVLLTEDMTAASRAAFVAEANLMAQLSHPYIVKIYHADVSDDGRPYLIMEYLAGRTLSQQYKAQPLSVVEALRVGIRLSGAIATAHAAGVLHRDIKPANVLTNDYGWPALTDFGIASALEEELPSMTVTRASQSETGATTGSQSVGMSIPWSPPEMFDDDPRPDVRSDVFSLSATVYTVLAGRSPFEVAGRSNQAFDLASRIERGAITPMDRTDVPSSLLAVLRKGMATDRDSRYATAVDFARALQRVELELSYSATPIEVPNLTIPEPQRPSAGDPADETRARGVTTVHAQPAVPAAPAVPPPPVARVAPEPVEATVVRGVAVAPAEGTVLRSSASAPPPPAERPQKSRTIIRAVIAVAVVLVGIVVTVVLVSGGILGGSGESPSEPTQAEVGEGGVPIVETVPAPVLESATPSADGTSVEFRWANPDGEDGDSFAWERTDGAGDGTKVPTDEPVAVITDVSPGTTVCVSVWVRRSGELSANPLEACTP